MKLPPSIIADEVEKAAALILQPNLWCQGSEAKDGDGWNVPAEDATACQFCFFGAIWCNLSRQYGLNDAHEQAELSERVLDEAGQIASALKATAAVRNVCASRGSSPSVIYVNDNACTEAQEVADIMNRGAKEIRMSAAAR